VLNKIEFNYKIFLVGTLVSHSNIFSALV
jgi:hypothetical protein